jgi:F-type H+-transporting ATPase subunit gamma
MGASLRELRQRRKSVTATKKITRAMELIASSRVMKAQQVAAKALPYTRELNRAVSAVATYSRTDHPLTRPQTENPRRVAVLFITSDRGMNGAYSSNVLKTVSQMRQRLDEQGVEMVRYGVGRKGIGLDRKSVV